MLVVFTPAHLFENKCAGMLWKHPYLLSSAAVVPAARKPTGLRSFISVRGSF